MTTREEVLALIASPRTAEDLAALTGRKLHAVQTDLRVLARNDQAVQLDGGEWLDGRLTPQGLWSTEALERVADRVCRAIRSEGERGTYTSCWLAEAIGRPAGMVRAAVQMMWKDERLERTPYGWALPVRHWSEDA